MTDKENIKELVLVGVVSYLIFLPITGMVLKGYNLEYHLERPLYLALAAVILKILVMLLQKSEVAFFKSQKSSHVEIGGGIHEKFDTPLKKALAILGLFGVCSVLPFFLGKYGLTVAIFALIYVLLGLGLNIVVGLAGLLDLGFVGFYAVGAYGYALAHSYLGMGFWTALAFCAVLAAVFGIILGFPVLRMHGDYLAIVTLGFGEIIRLVLNNWMEFTGGPNGMSAPYPSLFGLEFTRSAKLEGNIPFHEYFGLEYDSLYRNLFIYFILLVICGLTIYVVEKLKNMSMGRAWEALREDEIACRSLGINHVIVKLSAFAMGASIGGAAGVLFAAFQGFINPSSFTFFESALILAIVVLGGLGSTPGVIAAAIVLTVLPELLREVAEYRVLVFGILMVLMMIWRPRGLLKIRRPAYSNQPGGAS